MNTIKIFLDGDQLEQELQSPVVPRVEEHISLASITKSGAVEVADFVVERVDYGFGPNGVLSGIVVHVQRFP